MTLMTTTRSTWTTIIGGCSLAIAQDEGFGLEVVREAVVFSLLLYTLCAGALLL
jgi:hypothetical protein